MTIEDIALTMTPNLGDRSVAHLLEVFGDAQSIFAASEAELVEKAELKPHVAQSVVRRKAFTAAEREEAYCRKHGIHVVASTDAEYPHLLCEIPDYPHVLYVKGNVEVLATRCVAMVGTRRISSYGQQMCIDLVRGLNDLIPELCVVSGLAFGVDVACHRAAIACGAKTVAVLPTPLPEVVPTQHEAVAREILDAGGALVSELHSQTKRSMPFYLPRNRIIAGLGAGTVVVESPLEGGSLITAHYADGYNRSVMAVPGRVTDPRSMGTNMLIRNKKAQLVLSAQDIANELMWELTLPSGTLKPKPRMLELTTDEAHIMECFTSSDPVPAESIGVQCNLGPAELSVLLIGLEMVGALRQLPGNMYIKLA